MAAGPGEAGDRQRPAVRAQQNGPGCLEWCGDPWGSWGYQTVTAFATAYTHTYQKSSRTEERLPYKICVNFYDVHGGGTTASTFQLVNGEKEIQVDGNGDNSISTNAFNVLQGANCTGLSLTTHDASNANTGQRSTTSPISSRRHHERDDHVHGVGAERNPDLQWEPAVPDDS